LTRRGFARVHPLVKNTAREFAGAFFDNQDVFSDNRYERTEEFRIREKSQRAFVNAHWPEFVKLARKALTVLLAEPGRDESEKTQIYDALIAERGLPSDEDMVAPSIMRLN